MEKCLEEREKVSKNAPERYETAIQLLGGAEAYYDCGDKMATGGIKAVAECMKGLSRKEMDESDWAEKYTRKYT